MKTSTDMMARRVEVFSYRVYRHRWARRNRWLLAGAGLLALHAVAILGAMYLRGWQPW